MIVLVYSDIAGKQNNVIFQDRYRAAVLIVSVFLYDKLTSLVRSLIPTL